MTRGGLFSSPSLPNRLSSVDGNENHLQVQRVRSSSCHSRHSNGRGYSDNESQVSKSSKRSRHSNGSHASGTSHHSRRCRHRRKSGDNNDNHGDMESGTESESCRKRHRCRRRHRCSKNDTKLVNSDQQWIQIQRLRQAAEASIPAGHHKVSTAILHKVPPVIPAPGYNNHHQHHHENSAAESESDPPLQERISVKKPSRNREPHFDRNREILLQDSYMDLQVVERGDGVTYPQVQ